MARTKKNNSQTTGKPIEWLVSLKSSVDNNDERMADNNDSNRDNSDDTQMTECNDNTNDNTITDMSVDLNANSEQIATTATTTTSAQTPEIESNESDGKKVVIKDICFIECEINGSNSRQPSLMQNAFLSLKARKFNPKWITADKVMAIQCFDSYMFVCNEFEGQLFQFLVEKNARIIGPLCVHYCSNESKKHCPNLPNKPYPVFSQCMRDLYVSMSSFDGQKRGELKQKIERMGASFVKDLTKYVTHLVSDSVRTQKYKVASKLEKTVLTSQWVETCWQKQYELYDANDTELIDKYKVPIFKSLVISASQIEPPERDKLKELVEKNGGTYSGALKLNEPNAILLLNEPMGDKYKYARRKNLPCLHLKWVYDSVEKGYALPEENYAITAAAVTPKSHEKCLSNEKLRNVSLKKHQQNSQSFISQTKSNEDIEMVSDKTLTNRTTTTDSTKSSQIISNTQIIESIKAFSSNENDVHFLEGCILHVIGFDRTVIEVVKRAAISRGSLIMDNFSLQTSHVIVGPNSSKKDIDSLQTKSSQTDSICKFVTIEWIIDCFRYKELCDHSSYEINESSFKENRSTSTSEDSLKIPSNIELPETSRIALEKLRKTSEINKSSVHKSLVNVVNEETPIQWIDGSSESVSSQKPFSRTNSEESVREINLNEFRNNRKNISSNSNDEISNNSDNTGRILNRKASNELKNNSANNIEVATDVYVMENRSAVNEVIVDYKDNVRSSTLTLTVPIVSKVFMFSGYDAQIKAEFTDIVESLNATVIESDKVMETVTHLVVKNPSATEKVLSAIACGCWILKDDFLRESNKKRVFVCEEEYEWGTHLGNTGISKTEERSVRKSLMLSATEWRKHLKNERKTGAFEDWKVLILNQTNQTNSYSQILKCGKANIVYSCAELTSEQLAQFNYSFVDSNDYNSVSNINIMKDLVLKQKLYKIDFVSHYLINGPNSVLSPSISTKLLVKDVSNSREQRKRSANRMEGSDRHSKQRKNIQ